MTLLSEQVRIAASEANLINDPTQYSLKSAAMALLHDYGNITLTQDELVFFQYFLSSDPGSYACARLKIGNFYVEGAKQSGGGAGAYFGGLAWLAAGTCDVRMEACSTNGVSYSAIVSQFQLGFVQFTDEVGSYLAAYSAAIPLTVANRVTAVGPLLNATYAVSVFATTAGGVTNFENVGDNLTNGVSISVDGTQVNWSERLQDSDSLQYGHAKCFLPYGVGSSHSVTISKRNASTTVHISVVACPWILPLVAHSPVVLNFSQGSTLYVTLEPLFLDVTKFVGAGYPRGVDFGSADDYYNSLTGTGIQAWSYVLDVVKTNVGFDVWNTALGGCISNLGVDAR